MSGDVTSLLQSWRAGDASAIDRLVTLVYRELHRLAARALRQERGDHTLQTTALAHEAYLRLAGGEPPSLNDRAHFFALASRLMRHILVDHARSVQAQRRGGGALKVAVDELHGEPLERLADPGSALDVLLLDSTLSRLGEIDPRKARVLELRFFGGLSVAETAVVLGVSEPTVILDTRLARAWLLAELGYGESRAG
jgi:RNA polymerase sigma factor (TIGR02999 family)